MNPRDLRSSLQGLLGFPITPFGEDGEVELDVFGEQCRMVAASGVNALFPFCGTGEFYALATGEQEALLEASVKAVDGRIPVVAGVGLSVGSAVDAMRRFAAIGADGFLVFPPGSVDLDQRGLVDYYARIAGATDLGVIVYQKDHAIFTPAGLAEIAAIPNVIGLKDGNGKVDKLMQLRSAAVDSDLAFLNGTPTAELLVPALEGVGMAAYSSALLNFLPEIAVEFYEAVSAGDTATQHRLLEEVILPFVAIRDRGVGYGVSLVKTGARLRGVATGPVRPPLTEPLEADVDELRGLLDKLGLLGEPLNGFRTS